MAVSSLAFLHFLCKIFLGERSEASIDTNTWKLRGKCIFFQVVQFSSRNFSFKAQYIFTVLTGVSFFAETLRKDSNVRHINYPLLSEHSSIGFSAKETSKSS